MILDIFGSCVGESSDMSFLAEMRIARVMFVWPLMLITFVKFLERMRCFFV